MNRVIASKAHHKAWEDNYSDPKEADEIEELIVVVLNDVLNALRLALVLEIIEHLNEWFFVGRAAVLIEGEVERDVVSLVRSEAFEVHNKVYHSILGVSTGKFNY